MRGRDAAAEGDETSGRGLIDRNASILPFRRPAALQRLCLICEIPLPAEAPSHHRRCQKCHAGAELARALIAYFRAVRS
jgi:hypothetical protein